MILRLRGALPPAVASVLTVAAPAAAHGLRERADLPIPAWMFAIGAAVVVAASFVLMPVLRGRRPGAAPAETPPAAGTERRVGAWIARAASLVLFVLTALSAATGGSDPDTLAPVVVYIWFWVGLAIAHALFGNLWRTLSPWDTLARLLGIGARARRQYPERWGVWPAVALLLGFTWLELVFRTAELPSTIFVAIVVYTAVTMAGMWVFGREEWQRRGEAFAVYFGLLARIAPFARGLDGRIRLRAPLAGLRSMETPPGMVTFVLALIGTTTFDGLSGGDWWHTFSGELAPVTADLLETAALFATVGVVSLAYHGAMWTAARVTRSRPGELARAFVHTLVPIALAYAVAHYFSLLVLEGQLGIPYLSDPMGKGWNLFGTAAFQPNLSWISPEAIWYAQLVAIVAGHVAGVVLAHEEALRTAPEGLAGRSQGAFVGVMVLFTVSGLLILAAG